MKVIATLLVFSFSLIINGYSQQYNFTNYSINDGLSQSVVNCTFQDSRGFLWIGTQNGLNKFDGETFEIFRFNPLDTGSISNDWIYAISEDIEGNLWIGTKDGLNKYIFKQNKFKRIAYNTDYIYDITQYSYDNTSLSNGDILINTPPVISIYNHQKKSFTHYNSNLEYDGSVKDVKIPVLEDKGNIWIGSTRGLSRFSLKTKEFNYFLFTNKKGNSIADVNITAIYKDKNGTIWAGTTIGLFNYNPNSNQFEESEITLGSSERFSLKGSCVRTIIEDKNKDLIVGTEGNGLYILTENSIQNYTSQNSTIAHNIVQTLLIDQSENLWIGTLSGLSKTDLKRKRFKLYRNSNSPGSINLLGNVIASIFKNDDGLLWVGNWGQGLNLINLNSKEVEHFSTQQSGNNKIPNNFIHIIFKDNDGLIWIGTRDGIMIYDKATHKFVRWYKYFNKPELQLFHNVRIYSIIQDKSANYWIATQNGLYKVSSDKSTIEVFKTELGADHQLSSNLVYSVLEDSDGLIWIATLNGLDMYNPVTQNIKHFKKEKNGLSGNFIISLCEDSKGRIWIGTSTYVNVFDKKDSTFTYYSQKHGLPNNYIFGIVKDKNNGLWFATGGGLCKFNEQQNSFHTFTLEDGLQSLEFNLRADYVCEDGEIYMGGMNGFNSFYPDSLYKNPHKPKLVFTSFYHEEGSSKKYYNLKDLQKIELGHTIKSFTIEFAALEYTNPQKNQYAYKMKGISDEWIDIGNRKFVPFFALKPGNYTFMVKGSNNDGIWNDEAKSIDITIRPPWWRSIYAYISYLVIVQFIIVLFISMRERKLKHDKKLLEQKVLERTLQIEKQIKIIVSKNQELKELNNTKDKFFSIIGHDLGNHFNIIVGFSELLISDFKKLTTEKIQYHLNNIYNSSKHADNLLDNLLTWSRIQRKSIRYNPKEILLNKKINELLEFHKENLEKKKVKINYLHQKDITIYADKNMFSTVFRNLISNAIKYSHENGTISIDAKVENNYCNISIEDNGVGIPTENIENLFRIDSKNSTEGTNGEKGTGLGLILSKEFVEKHNGQIWVESKVDKGSKFTFAMPVK